MIQENIFEPVPLDKFEQLTREEMIQWMKVQRKINEALLKEVKRVRGLKEELETRTILIEDQCIVLRNRLFGKSSEKEKVAPEANPAPPPAKPKRKRVQLPSERYPDLPRIERHVEYEAPPDCKCCGVKLKDSGMTEDSEFLTVIPKQYLVIQQKRHKYRCEKCHGDVQTAPAPPRIKAGSVYSDEMMIDVAASKYCDLIPVQRYVKMAERSGVPELPQQSLIESTHYTAEFLKSTYELLKKEISKEKVLHADETPHRMLEGDDKEHWYLWGFSSKKACYFEAHDTRSGDVASDFLKDMACEHLVSDVYSGYGKAVRQANELRRLLGLPIIYNIYCNAHVRRRFKEAHDRFPEEAQFFIDKYKAIYRLESETVDKPPEEILALRKQMSPYFEEMKNKAIELIPMYSSKSMIGKAMSYLLGNFKEFTAFLENAGIPIDNNPQERLLRNPVIGRKTWYGTHSRRGAETMAILFSIIESCKLNKVNPREYLKQLIQDLHQGKAPYTPATFKAN
jgi:transposase